MTQDVWEHPGYGETAPTSMKAALEGLRHARVRSLAACDKLIDGVWRHARSANDDGLRTALSADMQSVIAIATTGAITLPQSLLSKAPELENLRRAAEEATTALYRAEDAWTREANGHLAANPTNALPGKVGGVPIGLTSMGMHQLFEAARSGQPFKFNAAVGTSQSDIAPSLIPDFDMNIGVFLRERTRIADLIPAQATDKAIVEFFRVNTPADAAAPVAPGADKPLSAPEIEMVQATVRKIAHYGKIVDEIMKDYAAWAQILGTEFIAGLINEENAQLLTGDGTGENLLGFLHTPGVLEYLRDTTNERRWSAILGGLTKVRTEAFVEPTVIVMHPTDFKEARTEESTSGGYLAGGPLEDSNPPNQAWGIPIHLTTQMTVGTALVGNMQTAARLYVREAPIWQVHPFGGGEAEWKSNQTLVRAEERLTLAVIRPQALCKVELL